LNFHWHGTGFGFLAIRTSLPEIPKVVTNYKDQEKKEGFASGTDGTNRTEGEAFYC
jgi:hypothetical protein